MSLTKHERGEGPGLPETRKAQMSGQSRVAIDHIAFPINPHQPLAEVTDIFSRLGFQQEWYQPRVGGRETAMETAVMSLEDVKFAIMRGIDGEASDGLPVIAQVNRYWALFGSAPQHYAIRVPDIKAFVGQWHAVGVKFITAHEDRTPRILSADKEDGSVVLQAFTYPLMGLLLPFFFEIKQLVRPEEVSLVEEFRIHNVEGLWESLDRILAKEDIFAKNIFGEPITLPPRYHI